VDARAVWDDLLGDAWVRHDDVIDGHSAPFGAAAMDALEPLAGAHILDVGCGTGRTTCQLAARARPDGAVIGVDLSRRMIDHARTVAAGVANVSFVVGDATTMRLDASLDAIYSRNGVMFFDDPVRAFAQLRSHVRGGGRLAFSCWRDPLTNPWLSVPVLVSAAVLGPPDLPGPGRSGPFAFPTTDVLVETLRGAGWTNIDIAELSVEQPYPAGDATASATVMTQTIPTLAAGLRRRPERRDDLERAIANALRPYERDGVVVLQAAGWIVSARS
jgi:SAM-dependent methyltransferase